MSGPKNTGLRLVLKREPSVRRKWLGVLASLVFVAEWVYAVWPHFPPPPVAPIPVATPAPVAVPPKSETVVVIQPIFVPVGPYTVERTRPESQPAAPVLPQGILQPYYTKEAQLHLVGVYEGRDPLDDGRPWWSKCGGDHRDSANMRECHARYANQHRQGFVEVDVSYSERPIILVLTAYNPVVWKVRQGHRVVIEGVILAGYHSQSVEGIDPAIPVRVYTYEPSSCERCWQAGGYFYIYQSESGIQGFESAERRLFEITGKRISSIQAKYKGSQFAIAQGIPMFSYPDSKVE
ncbi:hypothetical protein [Methylomagnum ishizawai]|uniref:hypothetical protein n=1 Tax=Methylomagnum ishizawai TaxID=1760988 RepID=UPI001C33DD80|nr:hypothetical protein [Methylomagnum ishizawai]BBL73747.1 hypothetical protein MishRS11D_08450 [Methylomagnum ishizawai]